MYNESIHGNYTLELKGNTVFCYYSDGFNLEGVKALTQEILKLTTGLECWVLFQRPDASAGIAQNAIVTMMNGYVSFQNSGCKAVALVDSSLFVRAGIPYHPEELTMPMRIEKDEGLLLNWLDRKIESFMTSSKS